MLINLYDSLWVGSECSVAWRAPRYIQYVRDLPEFDGVTIFTDSQINDPLVEEVKSKFKIGWLREPRCLHPGTYDAIDPRRFDVVLTYCQDLLGLPGFSFVPYGGVWISDKYWGIYPKSKTVSMLYGSKRAAPGHLVRHEIGELVTGIDYYGINGVPVNYSMATKMLVHKDYMFSVVVETCNEDNLFTEILLDCMAMGTIPILWGCPNSSQFFDDRGIIHFNEAKELEDIVPSLSRSLYNKMFPAIIANFGIAEDYAVTEDWMYTHVLRNYDNE